MNDHSRISIRCPHCQAHAKGRSTRTLSRTLIEIKYQCTDVECGHTYVASLEVVRTLSPSGKPSDDVRLPMSQRTIAGVMQQLSLL